MTTKELVLRFAALNEQKKLIEKELELLKPELINQVKEKTVFSIKDKDITVAIESRKAIKFADTVTNERIQDVLKEHTDIAIEFSLAMKNTGKGLASKLDIIMEPEETEIHDTVFPKVTVKKAESTTSSAEEEAPF